MSRAASLALVPAPAAAFDYDVAFSRNRGLISASEQSRLRDATVAIAGVGGAGGGHALTLARQGVGRFRLADPDTFSIANFNRQAAATMSSVGRNKAREVERLILEINPEAEVVVYEDGITEANIDRFLAGVDVAIDGIDFFAPAPRRLLMSKAREHRVWTLSCGPLGFSAALLAFDPDGMSFDDYCDITPGMTLEEQLIAVAVALAPQATHARYIDFSGVRVSEGIAPSAGLACMLCNAVVAMEVVALVLGRRRPRAAPAYTQIDLYRGVYRRGRLWFGNRGPLQRLKRMLLRKYLLRVGVLKQLNAGPV